MKHNHKLFLPANAPGKNLRRNSEMCSVSLSQSVKQRSFLMQDRHAHVPQQTQAHCLYGLRIERSVTLVA